jgi:hypothetical protein
VRNAHSSTHSPHSTHCHATRSARSTHSPRGLGLVLALVTAAAAPATPRAQPVTTRDPLIQRALDWLPRQPTVPVEVVDIDRLAPHLTRQVRGACGFVIRGVPRIYIVSRCRAYQRAEHSPLDAIALAAVIGHEMAHLDGADERQARRIELELVQTLAAPLPGEYRVRVAAYVADLRRRRPPVVCETNLAAHPFHGRGADGEDGAAAPVALSAQEQQQRPRPSSP